MKKKNYMSNFQTICSVIHLVLIHKYVLPVTDRMLVVAYKENCVSRLNQLAVFRVCVVEPAILFALLGHVPAFCISNFHGVIPLC